MLRQIKDDAGNVAASLGEMIVGILLLVNPSRFTSGIIIAFGALTALAGAYFTARYFMTEPRQASKEMLFGKGLLFLCAGLFCVLGHRMILLTFPALTVLYGALLLLIGLFKAQKAVDMVRMHGARWYFPAIGAALAVAAAVLIFINPFESALLLWIIIGLSLIGEAALDLVSLVSRLRRKKQMDSGAAQ